MQFSTALLAAITVGVQVLAAPSFVSKRTAVVESVAEDLYNTISTLEEAVAADVGDLRYLVADATSDVTVGAEVNVKLVSIVTSLNTAIASVLVDTTVAVPSIANAQVSLLVFVVNDIGEIVEGLVNIVEEIVSNLSGDALTLVSSELEAISALVFPILEPIQTFAQATVNLAVNVSLPLVTELQSSLATVVADVQSAATAIHA